ncbi:MAG: ABC transporter ATP-binding protein [Deltaproteobacteria bacterium]|jgi:ABC-2 type transport system ATP-binding protein|nr:ABC transporter ATP-binding protein [Deltaproteobacteria bacterium]MBW2532087.1 ABC transporter ATP-binding protein [Deltaproteobacteria bacterium]
MAQSAAGESRADEKLIDVRRLKKTFKTGLIRRKVVEAVRDVSFEVRRGEIVGFLGPNGSGKTTTIKILTGHIAATAGEAFLFGRRVPSVAARRRIGFLPENPYVYPYLTPREFVEMCGRLSGMRGRSLRRRCEQVLDQVGVLYAADRQVRRLSKGMLQRTALGAALVADPEMLILDEPMSGLDPVGRKEVRDILFEERDGGRTIFFSTHILSDVESMCDHVTILREGKVVVSGAIRSLLHGDVLRTDVIVADVDGELRRRLAEQWTVHQRPDVLVVEVIGQQAVAEVLAEVLEAGGEVVQVSPRRETLEDLFMRRAL